MSTSDQPPRFEPNWESLKAGYRIPRWYQDAKFGIFIHWGVYAVPALRQRVVPAQMYQQGTPEFEHHVATYGPQPSSATRISSRSSRPRTSIRRAWARLFKEAGARYVVPVAEHHDGFAMYDSKLTEWSAAKMGPKRDLIGELADAVRAEGLVFGVSSHRAENWFFFDGGRSFPSDVQDDRNRGLYGYALPEPADQGDPHAPEWPPSRASSTTGWRAPARSWTGTSRRCSGSTGGSSNVVRAVPAALRRLLLQPRASGAGLGQSGAAINYKYAAFPEGTAVFDIERGQLAGIRPIFWQTDTSVSKNSWGYVHNQDYKTAGSHRRRSGGHRQQERRAAAQHRAAAGWHDPRAGAGHAARDRPLAGDQRRGDLRHAAVEDLWRGADRGERGRVHRHQAPELHQPGHPLHHQRRYALRDRVGLARSMPGRSSRWAQHPRKRPAELPMLSCWAAPRRWAGRRIRPA